MILTVELLTA
jgi:enoyl-CoA hydratase/carnithine racemase